MDSLLPQGKIFMIDQIAKLMTLKGHTLSIIETTAGGGISAACVGQPGAGRWFEEGHVAYSHASKDRLGCDKSIFIAHGSVSAEAATHMAETIRLRTGTTIGLSETSIAGPGGGSPEKPVGTIFIGLSVENATVAFAYRTVDGNRSENKQAAIDKALQSLLDWLETN